MPVLQILFEPGRAIGEALAGIGQAVPSIFNQAGLRRGQALQSLDDPQKFAQVSALVAAAPDPESGINIGLNALGLDPTDETSRAIFADRIAAAPATLGTEAVADIQRAGQTPAVAQVAEAQTEEVKQRIAGAQAGQSQSGLARATAEALLRNDLPALEGLRAATESALGTELGALQTARLDELQRFTEQDPTAAVLMGAVGGQGVAEYLLQAQKLSFEQAIARAGSKPEVDLNDAFAATIAAGERTDEIIDRAVDINDPASIDQMVADIDRVDDALNAVRQAAGIRSSTSTIPLRDSTGLFGNKGKLTWERIELPEQINPRVRRQYSDLLGLAVEARALGPDEESVVRGSAFYQGLSDEGKDAFEKQVNKVFGRAEKRGKVAGAALPVDRDTALVVKGKTLDELKTLLGQTQEPSQRRAILAEMGEARKRERAQRVQEVTERREAGTIPFLGGQLTGGG